MAAPSQEENSTRTQVRRKRARLACVHCHAKKLKCDLESQMGHGCAGCSNCAATDSDCRLRPSKRAKRYQSLLQDGLNITSELGNVVHSQTQFVTSQPSAVNDASPRSDPPDMAVRSPPSQPDFSWRARSLFQFREKFPISSHVSIPGLPRDSQPVPSQAHAEGSSASHPTVLNGATEGYLGPTGFAQMFDTEERIDTVNTHGALRQENDRVFDLPPVELRQSFAETYLEYCYAWCPVLERGALQMDLATVRSPFLVNALALVGSRIRPPVLHHAESAVYYDRAKRMFYNNDEPDPTTCIQGIALLYWFNPGVPSTVNMDSAWWWTGIAIKLAQQMGLHREPKTSLQTRGGMTQSLRRRIWWTLFARERLTGISQGRPCTIDPEDCNVQEPSLDDFPDSKNGQGEIFIYWVRICGIIGRVSKYRSRSSDSSLFPVNLAQELIAWVGSLPAHLNLPISTECTTNFDRDVHQLHLPYLTIITILHMSGSTQPLPKAYTAAALAASCIARIFKDYLTRGSIRFLTSISCWYVGIAMLALLHTRRVEGLSKCADEDIQVLYMALKELETMWPSATLFLRGFERLVCGQNNSSVVEVGNETQPSNAQEPSRTAENTSAEDLTDLDMANGIDWTAYFPFVTVQTSGLTQILLAEHQDDLLRHWNWLGDSTLPPQDFGDPLGTFLDFLDLG